MLQAVTRSIVSSTFEQRSPRMSARHLSSWAESIPFGRICRPDEVSALVTFLASPKSVAVNGDTIAAGGGLIGPIHY